MPRVVMKSAGLRKYLLSPEVANSLKALVEDIAEDCNRQPRVDNGYIAKVSRTRRHARGVVITGTAKAIRDNARNNTVIRSAMRSR